MLRHHFAYTIAAIGLIVGLAASVGVVLERSFARVHSTRIFPLGYEHRARDWVGRTNNGPPTRADITLYGDSRTEHWAVAGFDSSLVLRNEAHGSVTSTQLLLQLLTETPIAARWSIVQVGINDLHPLGALSQQRSLIVENLKRNVEIIADQLSARSEHVVMLTVIPPGRVPLSRRWFWDRGTLTVLADVNRTIRQLPSTHDKLQILDAAALLGGDTRYLADEFVDHDFFLHLSPRAYDVLNRELVMLVNGARPQPQTQPPLSISALKSDRSTGPV